MNSINTSGNRFGFSRWQFYFIGISIFFLICCLALLIPFTRNFLLYLGESLIHRPLPHNHSAWHERFITTAISGIVLYFVLFFVFFLNNFLSRVITGKRAIIFVIAFLFLSVFVIMFRASWSFWHAGDEQLFINTTAINKYAFFNFYSLGRFYPFAFLHYNLPLFVFRCLGINSGLPVEAHFVVNSVSYIVTVLCLYLLFNKINPFKNNSYSIFSLFFICTFFLLSDSFSRVFLNLVYPELPIIMSFSIFMLMYYKALETNKVRYYAVALLAAVYSSYCKEPVFGVFLTIALVNLLFRYKKESKPEKIFYSALIINGIVFLVLYYLLSFRYMTKSYLAEQDLIISWFKLLTSLMGKNPVLIIISIVGIIRLYFIVFRKDKEHLYLDSLLFAGISYIFALFILHLSNGYYFLPSIILFLPSLVYWIKYLYEKKYTLALFLFFSLTPLYAYNFGQTAGTIKNIWQGRQEFMPYMTYLLSEYNSAKQFIWFESDGTRTDHAFFIMFRDYKKSVENSFLNYFNKSEGKDFFHVKKSMDSIDMKQDILFFYPVENDQNKIMPDAILKTLQNNNFELYTDFYGVLIYKRYLPD